MLSHANLWLGAVAVAHYLRLSSDDRVLAVLPLAFDYGQNQLLSAWAAGAAVVPHEYLLARDVVRAVLRHGATTLAGVPALWRQLLRCDWPEARLKRLTNSGGALDEPLVRALRAQFPAAEIHAMYGLTEAFRSTSLDPALIDAHPTSVGRAIPFAEVMVVRADGSPADPGEEGELVHAGPLVAQGYWRDPARTAERFRLAPAWSRLGGIAVWSGDRVRADARGLIHFIGRADAMIKTAGHRVSPQEVEQAAQATGLVGEAVALGLPDAELGQAIHLMASRVSWAYLVATRMRRRWRAICPGSCCRVWCTGAMPCRSAPMESPTAPPFTGNYRLARIIPRHDRHRQTDGPDPARLCRDRWRTGDRRIALARLGGARRGRAAVCL